MGRVPTLAVSEIFGPTFQGEGKHLGMPCAFLRLAGCNLACVWCDTPYTWDWKRFDPKQEITRMTIDEVYGRISEMWVRSLVISGGEPMLQEKLLSQLTARLHTEKWETHIETAGTIEPYTTELVKHWTVSPKLSNSGNGPERYNPAALEKINYAPSKSFKFVVSSISDFDEIDELVGEHGLSPVYIMPEGIKQDDIERHLAAVAGATIERGYNLTTRLHIQLYGNRRGV